MASDEMAHACAEVCSDVVPGLLVGERSGRFGDFAYDLFGKRANPEL